VAYALLENFISRRVRKGDIYIPATIIMLLKNGGSASIEQVAKLIYIFEYKYSIEEYKQIAKNLSFRILSEFSLVSRVDDHYVLNQWPIDEKDIDKLILQCYQKSNGFFKNL
jgi:hypothetical protein